MKTIVGIRTNFLIEILVAIFILLFVYTAANKLVERKVLEIVLRDYPLIGQFSRVVAWGLPIAELTVAALLFFPKSRLAGLYSFIILMSFFTIYLAYMLAFTKDLPCTCGGILSLLNWPQHFALNILFISLAILNVRLHKKLLDQSDESKLAYS